MRAYKVATGKIDGNIIAAIMSDHVPTNPASPRPIVPGMTPMSRVDAMTKSHASAAASRSADVSTIGKRRDDDTPAAGAVITPPRRTER